MEILQSVERIAAELGSIAYWECIDTRPEDNGWLLRLGLEPHMRGRVDLPLSRDVIDDYLDGDPTVQAHVDAGIREGLLYLLRLRAA